MAEIIDVGIVTWNTRDITLECLRRIVKTEHGVEIRLLIHDNASEDGTPEAVAREFPQVEVEVSSTNLGFAAGVNRLIARSSSDWFLTLNSDAWPRPSALAELVDSAARHPHAAAVAPRVESPTGVVEHTTQAFPTPGAALRLALPGYKRWRPRQAYEFMLPGAWQHDVGREVDWAIGAALLMRRSAIEQLGGFDERLHMYGEDLDWCWRASKSGWSIWFEPSAVICHLRNASGAQRYGSRRDIVSLRNTYEVAAWHQGMAATALARAEHVAWAGVSLLRSNPRSDRSYFWRAYLRSQFLAYRHRKTGGFD